MTPRAPALLLLIALSSCSSSSTPDAAVDAPLDAVDVARDTAVDVARDVTGCLRGCPALLRHPRALHLRHGRRIHSDPRDGADRAGAAVHLHPHPAGGTRCGAVHVLLLCDDRLLRHQRWRNRRHPPCDRRLQRRRREGQPSPTRRAPSTGADTRPADGQVFVVTRGDGRHFEVGAERAGASGCRAIPAGLARLQTVLTNLTTQQLARPQRQRPGL